MQRCRGCRLEQVLPSGPLLPATVSLFSLQCIHSAFSIQHSAFPRGSGLQSNLDPASGAAGQRSAAALPTASSRQESGRRAPESQVKAMNGSGQLCKSEKKRKQKEKKKKESTHREGLEGPRCDWQSALLPVWPRLVGHHGRRTRAAGISLLQPAPFLRPRVPLPSAPFFFFLSKCPIPVACTV